MAALMARTFPTSEGDAAASFDRDAATAAAVAVDAASSVAVVEEDAGGVTSLLGTLSAAAAVSSEVSEGEESSLGKGAAEEEGEVGACTSPRRFFALSPSPLLRL